MSRRVPYTGDSARSILAEAILDRKAKDASAPSRRGAFPKAEFNPVAVEVPGETGRITG